MDKMDIFDSMALGIYKLKYPIDCDVDLLGRSFEIDLGNIMCVMMFPAPAPRLSKVDFKDEISLFKIPGPVCPITSLKLDNKQDDYGCTKWGKTISYPHGDAMVKQLLIKVDLSEGYDFDKLQEVYKNIDKWFNRFYDIKELLTNIPYEEKGAEATQRLQSGEAISSSLMLYTYNRSKNEFSMVVPGDNITMDIIVNISDDYFSYEICSKVVDYANEQRELTFAHRYYLEGFRAFHLSDYVKAVAMCSPALERALLCGIRKFADARGIYFLDRILGKYKMLGGYFSLAEDLEMSLPTNDYRTSLLKLRNKVIHDGYVPTEEEAKKFVNDIGIYVNAFSDGLFD